MKGFFIEVTNNLLEKKHRKAMGTAVWEFMWCLDKITRIDDQNNGWILGGKPVRLKEIRENLGITEQKISKNLNKLAEAGYLELIHAPYGIVIKVKKAQKRFNQKGKPVVEKRFNQKGKAPNQKVKPPNQKGKPNKTRQITDTDNKAISLAPQDGAGKLINDLIDGFKGVNPNFERLFPNKTERKALERMTKKHGHEKIKKVIEQLVKTNSIAYAPVITTPLQLERKLGNLIAFYQRKRAEKEAGGIKINTL